MWWGKFWKHRKIKTRSKQFHDYINSNVIKKIRKEAKIKIRR
uniref:Bm1286 n=1 Tax=Brugia malayi TaxID=6279 RepID=A0A1I9GF28_BRUMA|nr:Bm1286 [Brugia malayi]